jgi:Flp pilus assembly protein TadG
MRALSRRTRSAHLDARDEDGQGVVEFALVLPILAALVVALFAFGKAVFFWNNVTQVANEGARLAAVNAGGTDPSFNFDTQLRDNLATGSSTKIYVSAPDPSAGKQVTVYICRTYSIPFYGNVNIVGKATMRLEQNLTSSTILAESTACP